MIWALADSMWAGLPESGTRGGTRGGACMNLTVTEH